MPAELVSSGLRITVQLQDFLLHPANLALAFYPVQLTINDEDPMQLHVYILETANGPMVAQMVEWTCGGEAHMLTPIRHRFTPSRRSIYSAGDYAEVCEAIRRQIRITEGTATTS